MTKGPLGGPRPLSDSELVVEVNLAEIDMYPVEPSHLARMRNDIKKRVKQSVGDVGWDENRGVAEITIKDGRVSPKEANAIGDVVYATLQGKGKQVTITTR